MPKADEPWTQLATRTPKELHRQLKLHCVHADTSLMAFVVAALTESSLVNGAAGVGRGTRARAKQSGRWMKDERRSEPSSLPVQPRRPRRRSKNPARGFYATQGRWASLGESAPSRRSLDLKQEALDHPRKLSSRLKPAG